jgi:hypothetical protein
MTTIDTATADYAAALGCHCYMPDAECHRGERVHGEWRDLPCACRVDHIGLAAVSKALEAGQ